MRSAGIQLPLHPMPVGCNRKLRKRGNPDRWYHHKWNEASDHRASAGHRVTRSRPHRRTAACGHAAIDGGTAFCRRSEHCSPGNRTWIRRRGWSKRSPERGPCDGPRQPGHREGRRRVSAPIRTCRRNPLAGSHRRLLSASCHRLSAHGLEHAPELDAGTGPSQIRLCGNRCSGVPLSGSYLVSARAQALGAVTNFIPSK